MTQIPDGMTMDEVVATIDKVANRLASRFKFGYHTIDDMKQQARMYAWMGLSKYDNVRPLENFLWTHVRNRLFNFKRKFQRPDLPCLTCPIKAYDPNLNASSSGCTEYCDKMECPLYERWKSRNERKRNIMNTIGFDSVLDENEESMRVYNDLDAEIDIKDFFVLIEEHIPIEMKADLIRLRNNVPISKPRRQKIYKAIRQILEERGLNEPEAW
jgi:DNA-directed RNA polymerase specialized sigma24 family protein